MMHRNVSIEGFEGYLIKSCTNTGVWEVERIDTTSGAMLAHYDFVNKEYMGLDTGGAALPIESLGGVQERDFFSLQKALNKALLN